MAQDNSTGPDVRYLPKWGGRARLGEFAAAKAKRRLTPAGEPGTADAVRGFAPKFHTEGNRISSATAHWSQSFDMEQIEEKYGT
jgi:hypothetical protein